MVLDMGAAVGPVREEFGSCGLVRQLDRVHVFLFQRDVQSEASLCQIISYHKTFTN